MPVTVVITDWRVPFDQVVRAVKTFTSKTKAVAFINAASAEWWRANDGDRCCREMKKTEPYSPITELGYSHARYELWGGEYGFHAMIDHKSYARLNNLHYKGKALPGYLLTAKLSGRWPA